MLAFLNSAPVRRALGLDDAWVLPKPAPGSVEQAYVEAERAGCIEVLREEIQRAAYGAERDDAALVGLLRAVDVLERRGK